MTNHQKEIKHNIQVIGRINDRLKNYAHTNVYKVELTLDREELNTLVGALSATLIYYEFAKSQGYDPELDNQEFPES